MKVRIRRKNMPSRMYIETHLGGGAVMRRKPAALRSIGIDLRACAVAVRVRAQVEQGGVRVRRLGVGVQRPAVPAQRAQVRTPLPAECRPRGAAGTAPGAAVRGDGVGVSVGALQRVAGHWRSVSLQVMNQAGVVTEKVWFNFTPDRVHWASCAGRNFTHRQAVKRKAAGWGRRYAALGGGAWRCWRRRRRRRRRRHEATDASRRAAASRACRTTPRRQPALGRIPCSRHRASSFGLARNNHIRQLPDTTSTTRSTTLPPLRNVFVNGQLLPLALFLRISRANAPPCTRCTSATTSRRRRLPAHLQATQPQDPLRVPQRHPPADAPTHRRTREAPRLPLPLDERPASATNSIMIPARRRTRLRPRPLEDRSNGRGTRMFQRNAHHCSPPGTI